MKWTRHKILSKDDMKLLAGTHVMQAMQRHRLVIKYDINEKQPTFEQMGLYTVEGLVFPSYMQQEQRGNDTLEILFENETDMDIVEQSLTQFKMGQD